MALPDAPADYAAELSRCSNRDGLLPPDCSFSFLTSREYLPPAEYVAHWHSSSIVRQAQDAFDGWLCSLPTTPSVGGMIVHTLGKIHLERARFLHMASLTRLRHVVKAQLLGRWTPRSSRECEGGASWTDADVCETTGTLRSRAVPRADARRTFGMDNLTAPGRWRQVAQGRTASSLWWAGQMARLAHGAIGECGRKATSGGQAWLPVRTLGALNRGGIGAGKPRSIGVYIRRGDACGKFVNQPLRVDVRGDEKPKARRQCYAVGLYMHAVHLMRQKYGARRLVLATDSPSVVQEVTEHCAAHDFEVSHVVFDRLAVGGTENATRGLRNREALKLFIENRAGVDQGLAYTSFQADLDLLSEADMFVGTSASEMSRLALLAIVGRAGVLPPFALIDRPLGQVLPERPPGGAGDLLGRTPAGGWLRMNQRKAELAVNVFDPLSSEKLQNETSRVMEGLGG